MLQAAAFAYAYYIADSNLYIDSFILSRQVDAPSELRSSLAFGLWTTSSITDANIQPAQKKYIWEVFKNIDRRSTTLEYSAFAKGNISGYDAAAHTQDSRGVVSAFKPVSGGSSSALRRDFGAAQNGVSMSVQI